MIPPNPDSTTLVNARQDLPSTPTQPPRQRRTHYIPEGAQEEFIVPLLKTEIEGHLALHLSSAGSALRVLDVGCGGQPFRPFIEAHGGIYTSMDREQNLSGTVEFLGRIDDPLSVAVSQSGPYDLVLCTEVMEHVIDWKRGFNNLASLLRGGGDLVMSCPFIYPLHETPVDYWRPTPFALRAFASDAGLEVSHEVRLGDGWAVYGTLLSLCRFAPASSRLLDRLLHRIILRFHAYIRWWLLQGRLQTRVTASSPMFLSTVMLFHKKP